MSLFSEKIEKAALDANALNKTYKLNEFRSTVNYVNTTNKGYVRFTRSDNG